MTLYSGISQIGHEKHKQLKKKNKLAYIKIKNFCASKGTTHRVKRQLTEWEELFAKHIS